MYALAAALPPVAILVLAAGSLVFRRKRRPKHDRARELFVEKPFPVTVVAKPKAKKARKRSKKSSQSSAQVELSEAGTETEGRTQQPELGPLEHQTTSEPSSVPSTASSATDHTFVDGPETWTTVRKKSRPSRASIVRAEAKADSAADPQATKAHLTNDHSSSSSAVDPAPRQQSSSVSSAEEASARAQAKWFSNEETHPRSQSQGVQPVSNVQNNDEHCAKEGHLKRRCSACQSLAAPVLATPLQKSHTGKNWAAVTADKADNQLASVKDLASFPLFNRSSEFGAIGDRVVSYQAVKAKVDTGSVRTSSVSSASESLAKRSLDSEDSTFSSPRSIGSVSPRSQSSTLDGMSDEDEFASKAAAAELEYVARQNLTRPKDFANDLKTLPERMDSSDWLEVAEALNSLRALVFFHSAATESVMPVIAPQILKAMKNPRSALQKTAIMALTDALSSLGDNTLPWIGLLLLELFLKASQDKKFVCEAAGDALRVMAASVSPGPLLEKLLPFTAHKSQRVRAKAITATYGSLIRMNVDEIVAFGHERLLKAAKRLQTDKQPEAREAARKMLELLESQGKIAPVAK